MTVGPGRFRLVVAGALVAFGFQTMLLFLGYALGLSYGGNREGIGGPLGLVGGYLLAGAGFLLILAVYLQSGLGFSTPRCCGCPASRWCPTRGCCRR